MQVLARATDHEAWRRVRLPMPLVMVLCLAFWPIESARGQIETSLATKSTAALGTADPLLTHMGERLQGEIGISGRMWRWSFDGGVEILRDQDGWRTKAGLRELSVDLFGDRVESRIGWQTPDVGRLADGVVGELFTRLDLRDFTLPDREDLVIGTPMLRMSWFTGADYVDWMVSPLPFPTLIPAEGSRWDPLAAATPIPIRRTATPPAWSADQLQAAVRFALRSPRRLNMDLVAGRWSGSIPVFGLEISPTAGPSDGGASRFELVESFPARWLAGVSLEWLVGEAWLATHEHLFILNQRSIEAPVRTDLVRASLADPAAIQALFGMLAPREDLFLSPMPASSHQIAVTRSAGRWTAAAGMRMDLLHGDMERRFQRPRFTTVDASVNWRAFRDRFRLDIDATCHLSPADIWVHPSVTWEASDAGIWTAGAQLFGGEDPRDPLHAHLSYHRLRGDGFFYLRFTRHLI